MAAGCCKEADTLPNTGLAAPANWQSTKRQEERMSEQQRVAIVTGAAGGIGRELVLGLLGKGLRIAAVDRTPQGLADLAQAAQERQQGANLMTIEADLSRDESIDEIVSKARSRFGVIDILVNNAGVGQATIRNDNRQHPIKFWEVTPEQWKLFSAGVTVNVLVPGGVTNTGMVPLEAGYDRAEMIQPAVMAPPLNWLVSDAAGGVTGRRFLAVHWVPGLPPEEAAAKAGAPVAWTEIATMPIEPPRRN